MNYVWFTTKGQNNDYILTVLTDSFIYPKKSFQSHLMTSQKVPIIKTFSKKERDSLSVGWE